MAAAGVAPRDLSPLLRRGLHVAGDQGRGGAPRKARKLRDLAMSPPGPSPATDILSAVKAAGSAEEIFALLGVAYDPKRLNVARLHILKRMSAHLDEAELDTLPADVVQSRLKDALARAYEDFASASPLELRVFKVLQQAAEPDGAAAAETAAFVPIDTLRTS